MRFANNLKTTLLLASLMGLCMLIGYLFLGPHGMLIGLLFGGLGNLIAFFYSDKIALMSMGGREVHRSDVPWLFDMIERLSQRAGLPMPRVYICPQAAPNAFATGRSPNHAAVALTQGMLRNFPEHEIEGVIAHELGLIGLLATIILAPFAALLIQAAISRQREYAADSHAGELCGDPRKLAAALQRLQAGNERIPTETPPAFHNLYIVEPLSASGMSSLFGTHPPIEKRIAALRAQAAQMR
jgi:heat shock protein HtpX